jgi:pimeloyl-ACP methyl ester carboxylesterase
MPGGIGRQLDELVVVVPGILGSRLTRVDRDGSRHEIWGTNAAVLLKNLVTFGHRVKRLAIDAGADPEEPKDGIVPTGLITDFQLIPGFTGIAGYDGLIQRLRHDNRLQGDQVIGFSYDWRLSNRVNGRKLAKFLDRQVSRWRDTTGKRDSRAVLICHSMGGLVARWCTEREQGHELVSRTITIGTPYKGAGIALDVLANGVRLPKRLGPRFDDLVRSLPSVRELLPTYPCVKSGGQLKRLDEVDILPSDWVSDGLGFHRELAEAVRARDPKRTDTLDAFRGGLQPTLTSASLGADRLLAVYESWDGTAQGENYAGDGTVPRDSATPPEWSNQSWAKAVAQRHAKMQLAPSVQTELNVMLTDAPRRMSAGAPIGVRLSRAVPAGQPFDVTVSGPSGLGLTAVVDSLDGTATPVRKIAKTDANGIYHIHVGPLAAGLYDIRIVRSSSKAAQVDEVSDMLLVYSETDAGESCPGE